MTKKELEDSTKEKTIRIFSKRVRNWSIFSIIQGLIMGFLLYHTSILKTLNEFYTPLNFIGYIIIIFIIIFITERKNKIPNFYLNMTMLMFNGFVYMYLLNALIYS